jgi:hypothetical protein
MPKISIGNILPCLQTLKSITSIQGDNVTFNISGSRTSFYSYDKARELQIFGVFPKTVTDSEGDFSFSVSLERFRTLVKGQALISLSFGKDGLRCSNKYFNSTIEAGLGEVIEVPVIDKDRLALSELIYGWVTTVKLSSLFKKEDMFVFIKYSSEEKQFQVCCADNWHTALLTAPYEEKGLKSFNIALPIRYLDYANRLIDGEANVHLYIDGGDTYFFNEFVILKLPTVAIDTEVLNIEAVVEFTANCRVKKKQPFVIKKPQEILEFLRQTKAIAESDRDNQVKLTTEDGTLHLFTETKHGKMSASKRIEGTDTTQVTVNSKALLDIIGHVPADKEVKMFIGDNTLYLRYVENGIKIELTTIGTSDAS